MSKFWKHLKIAWTYFNGWRKKYWLTRTLIILIIFSTLIYDNISGKWVICDLVKIGCDAIFYGSIPKSENALCKYYKIVEIKRLQTSIIVYADKNQNGVLDADEIEFLKSRGCDTEQIRNSVIKADMDTLAYDAGRLGLLPPAYSTTQIRKNAFNAAHSETEFTFNPMKDEVYGLIERMSWLCPKFTEKQMNELKMHLTETEFNERLVAPDYLSWRTWGNGLKCFLYAFPSLFGPLIATVLWFSISIMIGLFFAITFKSHRKLMSALASLVFLFFIVYLRGNIPIILSNNLFHYYFLSLGIFSIVAGLTGFKISIYVENRRKWQILTPLIIGLLIIAWSFNLDFLFKGIYCCYGWGFGSLISPSSVTQFNSFSQNSATFATVFILIYLGFLVIYYQNEISDYLCTLKRRKK